MFFDDVLGYGIFEFTFIVVPKNAKWIFVDVLRDGGFYYHIRRNCVLLGEIIFGRSEGVVIDEEF